MFKEPDENILYHFSSVYNKIERIWKWFENTKEAPYMDPNAFELVDMFISINNLSYYTNQTVRPVIKIMVDGIWENRKANFIKNNIGIDNEAYRICEACHDGELSKTYIDNDSADALKKIAGITLWFEQTKRDGQKEFFDNNKEWEELNTSLEAAKLSPELKIKYIEPGFERIETVRNETLNIKVVKKTKS